MCNRSALCESVPACNGTPVDRDLPLSPYPILFPQPPQNFTPGLFWAPHTGHACAPMGESQLLQYLPLPARAPQRGQIAWRPLTSPENTWVWATCCLICWTCTWLLAAASSTERIGAHCLQSETSGFQHELQFHELHLGHLWKYGFASAQAWSNATSYSCS